MDKFWRGFNLAIGQNAIFGEDLIWRKAQKQFFFIHALRCVTVSEQKKMYIHNIRSAK